MDRKTDHFVGSDSTVACIQTRRRFYFSSFLFGAPLSPSSSVLLFFLSSSIRLTYFFSSVLLPTPIKAVSNDTTDPTRQDCGEFAVITILIDDSELFLMVYVWCSEKAAKGLVAEFGWVIVGNLLFLEVFQIRATEITDIARKY